MKRTIKKTLAAISAVSILTTAFPVKNVYAKDASGTDSFNVDFCYDDGAVDTEGFFFMKNGQFNTEADEDSVLVLIDKNGNKTEIASKKDDGSRVFTSVAVTRSFYNLATLENDQGKAFVRPDGSYFGKDNIYYDYDNIEILSEHVILAKNNHNNEDGTVSADSYIITDTGKSIKFEGISRVETTVSGDTLFCYEKSGYRDKSDVTYAYNSATDQLVKLTGSFYMNSGYIFISTEEKGTKMYDLELNCVNDSLPANYTITGTHSSLSQIYFEFGYNIMENENHRYTYTRNILDGEGNLWAEQENDILALKIIDGENGVYCASRYNEAAGVSQIYIMSKDQSVQINLTEEIKKLDESVNITGLECIYEMNKDIVAVAKKTGNIYVFDCSSGYAQVNKLDTAGYVNVINGYLLIGSNDNGIIRLQSFYDSNYNKVEAAQPEIKYRGSITAAPGENEKWIFRGSYYDMQTQTNYDYLIAKDGTVKSYTNIYADSSSGLLFCTDKEEARTDIYKQNGDLFYQSSGNYLSYSHPKSGRENKYYDGGVMVITESSSEYGGSARTGDFFVISADGQVYFDSKDCHIEAHAMTSDGDFLACVFQTDENETRKYGAYTKGAVKELTGDNDVSVKYENGIVQDGAVLVADILTEEDDSYKKIDIDAVFSAYEISLLDKNGEKIQPNGTVSVTIPCPNGYQGEKCKVYYLGENNKMQDMKAVYNNGYMQFETDHFSTYIITEADLKTSIWGDANGDGEVNSKDAVMLKKHLAGFENLNIDMDAADVNEDGEVNSKDAVRLLRYLAGYDMAEAYAGRQLYYSVPVKTERFGEGIENEQIAIVKENNVVQGSSIITTSYGFISLEGGSIIGTGDEESGQILILSVMGLMSVMAIIFAGKKVKKQQK